MRNVLFLMSIPRPWRAAAFAKKRSTHADVAMRGRELLLPPGRGKAGMGVECRHSAGQVSTPSPALPLPGGGSQNIGRTDFGGQASFHNAKGFVSHEAAAATGLSPSATLMSS